MTPTLLNRALDHRSEDFVRMGERKTFWQTFQTAWGHFVNFRIFTNLRSESGNPARSRKVLTKSLSSKGNRPHKPSQPRREEYIQKCAWCSKVCDSQGKWIRPEEAAIDFSDPLTHITHGICPECSQKVIEDISKKQD